MVLDKLVHIRSRAAFLGALLLAGLVLPLSAAANAAQERLAESYLKAAAAGDPQTLANMFHPTEVEELRTRLLKLLGDDATQGGGVRARLFGAATTLDEVRRLTPVSFLLALSQRASLAIEPLAEVKVLGVVEENSQLVHAVARLKPADATARARIALVSLSRYGSKDWRVALPQPFLARIDALIAEGGKAAGAAAAPATPNTPEILSMIDSASALLRAGACTTYFTEHMSPGFRGSTSAKALSTLISQCQKSEDTRETYIAALELAKRLTPRYEQNGARAVYDMQGQGLPFKRYVLEKVGDRWFIAE